MIILLSIIKKKKPPKIHFPTSHSFLKITVSFLFHSMEILKNELTLQSGEKMLLLKERDLDVASFSLAEPLDIPSQMF